MKHNNPTQVIAVLICILLIVLCVLLATPAHAYEGERITTARQAALHEAADILRSCGYAEDSEVIRAIQAEWRAEQEKLDIIAKVIDHEAPPAWCEWEHSVAVGVVVLNRVASPLFPNTVREVVAAPGQYLRSYTYDFADTSRIAYEAAAAALDGAHDVPEDCYWQDTHVQGAAIWRAYTVDTGWYRSTTYICRGVA